MPCRSLKPRAIFSGFSRRTVTRRAIPATLMFSTAARNALHQPPPPMHTFGYVLHPVDLATNKVMAAGSRRELRDIVDVVTVHETILPVGAVVWAAVEKSPGYTPEGLIAEIR